MPNYYSDPDGRKHFRRMAVISAAMVCMAIFLHRHQLVVSAGDGGGGGINACVVDWGCFRLATEFAPPANAAPAASPETADDDSTTIAI
jgi:hypothetical protein